MSVTIVKGFWEVALIIKGRRATSVVFLDPADIPTVYSSLSVAENAKERWLCSRHGSRSYRVDAGSASVFRRAGRVPFATIMADIKHIAFSRLLDCIGDRARSWKPPYNKHVQQLQRLPSP
jgi:hypothetical protein